MVFIYSMTNVSQFSGLCHRKQQIIGETHSVQKLIKFNFIKSFFFSLFIYQQYKQNWIVLPKIFIELVLMV